jgi:hypothetical protein
LLACETGPPSPNLDESCLGTVLCYVAQIDTFLTFMPFPAAAPNSADAFCDGYVISGNKAFIVYRIDADHAEWGTLNMSEVAIQEWSNGKVVREKFVY